MHKLGCVGFFPVDGQSIGVYFQVEEVWDAVVKSIYCELKIFAEAVEFV